MEDHQTSSESNNKPRLIRFYRWLWRFWKESRFQKFVTTMNPRPGEKILDIGGYPFNWYHRGSVVTHVDVLNLDLAEIGSPPPGAPSLRALSGDARHLELPDRNYDIVFSNSVIEHVGDYADQQAFAKEAMRVGKRLWIQTPAKECPVEPHFLGLMIHWFPRKWHVGLARWTSIRGLTGSAKAKDLAEIAGSTRLLSRKEFSTLFPGCEIWVERMLWVFPKSYVAIRNPKS